MKPTSHDAEYVPCITMMSYNTSQALFLVTRDCRISGHRYFDCVLCTPTTRTELRPGITFSVSAHPAQNALWDTRRKWDEAIRTWIRSAESCFALMWSNNLDYVHQLCNAWLLKSSSSPRRAVGHMAFIRQRMSQTRWPRSSFTLHAWHVSKMNTGPETCDG